MCTKLTRVTFVWAFFVAFVNVDVVIGNSTEQQMWATSRLIRDVCLPKFPRVSSEMANRIRYGEIPDTREAKCYINCVLELMQTMRKGKFLLEPSLRQVELLMPEKHKNQYRIGLTKCKDAALGVRDHCEAAYLQLLCLRGQIEYFVFP